MPAKKKGAKAAPKDKGKAKGAPKEKKGKKKDGEGGGEKPKKGRKGSSAAAAASAARKGSDGGGGGGGGGGGDSDGDEGVSRLDALRSASHGMDQLKQMRAHRAATLRAARDARLAAHAEAAQRAAARDPQLAAQAAQAGDPNAPPPEEIRYRRFLRFLAAAPQVDAAPLLPAVIDKIRQARDAPAPPKPKPAGGEEGEPPPAADPPDEDPADERTLVERLESALRGADGAGSGSVPREAFEAALAAEGNPFGFAPDELLAVLRRFQRYGEASGLDAPSSSGGDDEDEDGGGGGGGGGEAEERRLVFWLSAKASGFNDGPRQPGVEDGGSGEGGADGSAAAAATPAADAVAAAAAAPALGEAANDSGRPLSHGALELSLSSFSAVPFYGADEEAGVAVPSPFLPSPVMEVITRGNMALAMLAADEERLAHAAGRRGGEVDSLMEGSVLLARHLQSGSNGGFAEAVNGGAPFGSVLCDRAHAVRVRALGGAAGVDEGGDARVLDVRVELVEQQGGGGGGGEEEEEEEEEGGGAEAKFAVAGMLLGCGEHDIVLRLERTPLEPLEPAVPAESEEDEGEEEEEEGEEGGEAGAGASALVHEMRVRGEGATFMFPPEHSVALGQGYRLSISVGGEDGGLGLDGDGDGGSALLLPRVELQQRPEWVCVPRPLVTRKLMLVGSVLGLDVGERAPPEGEGEEGEEGGAAAAAAAAAAAEHEAGERVEILLRPRLEGVEAGAAGASWPPEAHVATTAIAAISKAAAASTAARGFAGGGAAAAGAPAGSGAEEGGAAPAAAAAAAAAAGDDRGATHSAAEAHKAAIVAASTAAAAAAAAGAFCHTRHRNGAFELDARAATLPDGNAISAGRAGSAHPEALAAPAPAASPTFLDLFAPEMALSVRVPSLGLVLEMELRKGGGWGEPEAAAAAATTTATAEGADPAAGAAGGASGDDGAKAENDAGAKAKADATSSEEGKAAEGDGAAAGADGEAKKAALETPPAAAPKRGNFRLFGRCAECPPDRLVTLELKGQEDSQLSVGAGDAWGFPECGFDLPLLDGMLPPAAATAAGADADATDATDDAAAAAAAAAVLAAFGLKIKCAHVTVSLGLEEVWAEDYSAGLDGVARKITKHFFKGTYLLVLSPSSTYSRLTPLLVATPTPPLLQVWRRAWRTTRCRSCCSTPRPRAWTRRGPSSGASGRHRRRRRRRRAGRCWWSATRARRRGRR